MKAMYELKNHSRTCLGRSIYALFKSVTMRELAESELIEILAFYYKQYPDLLCDLDQHECVSKIIVGIIGIKRSNYINSLIRDGILSK